MGFYFYDKVQEWHAFDIWYRSLRMWVFLEKSAIFSVKINSSQGWTEKNEVMIIPEQKMSYK